MPRAFTLGATRKMRSVLRKALLHVEKTRSPFRVCLFSELPTFAGFTGMLHRWEALTSDQRLLIRAAMPKTRFPLKPRSEKISLANANTPAIPPARYGRVA